MHAYSAVLRIAEIARRGAADRDPDADYIAGIALIARNAADTAAEATALGVVGTRNLACCRPTVRATMANAVS